MVAAAVSATVEESLVRGLQQDLDGLRDENREVCGLLNEANSEKKALGAENAELRDENARLRKELQAMQSKNSKLERAMAGATAPPSIEEQMEELSKEVAAALEDALGADSDTLDGARGAARRRSVKPSSSVAASAVKTARRAQATWAAEHSKLEEQKLEAQRAATSRAAELEDAHAALRRVRQELNASKRGLQDMQLAEARRLEALETQQQGMLPSRGALAVPTMAARPKSRQQGPQGSQFGAYMQAREQGAGGDARALMQDARAMMRGAGPSDATRLPALKTSAGSLGGGGGIGGPSAAPATSTDPSSLRHMTEALSRKWQSHVQQSSALNSNAGVSGLGGGGPAGPPMGPPRRRYY